MSNFEDRAATNAALRASHNFITSPPGTGAYVGEEIANNYYRRQAGQPEEPLTWGVEPEERKKLTYEGWKALRAIKATKQRKPISPLAWFGRWLAKSWIQDRFEEMVLAHQQDIEDLKSEMKESESVALSDGLTGLPNRRLFAIELDAQIARAQRGMEKVAVMMVDLDYFKQVNDTLGHGAGDELLKRVAEVLRKSVRAGDVVARLGGDEFAIFLCDIKTSNAAEVVAQKVLDGLHELGSSASIGIAVGNQNREYLLELADRALYVVKAAGRDGYRSVA